MIEFLDNNSAILTLIFAAVVTLSTVVYAILTAFLVAETRKLRQVQTEPRIEVVTQPREEWINLIHIYVKNIGLGPAYDIRFEVRPISNGTGATKIIQDITKTEFFKTGLKYLGPGQHLISNYTQMTDDFDSKIESVIEVCISYKSATGNYFREIYRLDFSEYKGRAQFGKPHLYAISQHLEAIQKDFHNLATGFKKIQADIYDNDDREKEKKYFEEKCNKKNKKEVDNENS